MASIRRKSAAVALAVVGVAGLTLASAAQLNINSESLGAGTEVVASCDETGVDVGFTTAWDATNNDGYNASAVSIENIDDTCAGQEIAVTLLDGTTVIEEFTGTLPALAAWTGTFSDTLTTAYDAELIDGVSIVIHG